MTFLIVGSFATKWRFEEKSKISAEEANDGVRGWRNVMANGGMASVVVGTIFSEAMSGPTSFFALQYLLPLLILASEIVLIHGLG